MRLRKFSGFSLSPKKVHAEQRLAPDGLRRQEGSRPPKMSFPFACLGNRTREVQNARSKGLNILRPVLNEEPVGLSSKGRV